MSEPATSAALAQPTDRVYYIERFYSLVAGASEDRIGLTLREDLQRDALNAAYTIEAWLEEVQGREEKYDRLATLARSISPISDLLRTLAKGVYNDFFAQLISSYEEKHVQSILAQREELRQSAGEADEGDLPAHDDDPLTALLAVVATPDGRDDYVAWFQIGWLYWKRGVLDEAENAFRTGASFSQRQSSWYFAQSLRHEAYMQWKRGNFERSRSTIRRAIEIRRDPGLLVEAARYSMACGQQLESQSLLDEALHSDPFVFVSVLADTAFSSAVTSTVDILVRQQTRATEAAKNEQILWSDTIDLIKLAEKLGDILLLPESADGEFRESSLDGEIDFPTAIFRFDQAKASREAWASRAVETIQKDTEEKSKELELAETSYRTADECHKAKIDKIDSEQRIEELLIQDEHDQAPMPSIPPLKAEIMNGLLVGLAIFVVGLVILAGLSQLIFKSIPPLVPISPLEIVLISPLVAVMVVFGLFGFVTLPLLRIRKATILFNEAAQYAEFEADTKLKKVANESANQRESIKREWTVQKSQLEAIVDTAEKRLRAAVSAQTTLKRLHNLRK